MSKGKNNILVTIILLIFVGQAMASASMLCPMLVKTDTPTEMIGYDMSEMNHSMPEHDMSTMPSNMECCSDDSNCNMSGCISLALPNETELTTNTISNSVAYFELIVTPTQKLSSLYRPPIFA